MLTSVPLDAIIITYSKTKPVQETNMSEPSFFQEIKVSAQTNQEAPNLKNLHDASGLSRVERGVSR